MKREVLSRLEREAQQPAGVAPVMCCSELKQLLDERGDALTATSLLSQALEQLREYAPNGTIETILFMARATLAKAAQ